MLQKRAEPANKGCWIWYSSLSPLKKHPANPDDLRKSCSTKQKEDVIECDFGDSRKTVYVAVQIEHKGKKGPWALVSALIP
jgi:hypothetical protein